MAGGVLCASTLIHYNIIFEFCVDKGMTVNDFMDREGNISFRKWLPNILHAQWEELKTKVLNQHLTNTLDTIF